VSTNAGDRCERAREAAPGIHVKQKIFDANPWQVCLNDAPKLADTAAFLRAVQPRVLEATIAERREGVRVEPARQVAGGLLKVGSQPIDRAFGIRWEVELAIRGAAFLFPLRRAMNKIPERHVVPTLRQVQITGAECVTHGERQRNLPETVIGRSAGQRRLGSWRRGLRVEPPPKLDGREQWLHAGLPAEWQPEKAR
jgi:hypothetical protein